MQMTSLDQELGRRVLDAAGLLWREGDESRLQRVLAPRLALMGVASAEAYVGLLGEGGPVAQREREWLTGEFSTGETYFMRDPGLFELLAGHILPELVGNRPPGRPLRIWSAGCASGEEPYSLAMLVDELGLAGGSDEVDIVGTDISGSAIARAQAGCYGQWSFRSLDAARRDRYFRPAGGQLQVIERLRAAVRFERHDLLGDGLPEPGKFDLILCRNVFIYLSAPTISRVVAKFAAGLDTGGYLIPGHGELSGAVLPALESVAHPQALLYRRSVDRSSSLLQATVDVSAAPRRGASRRAHPAPRAACAGAATPAEGRADVETILAQAWRDADRGATQSAQTGCECALRVSPFDPRAYYLLAQLAQERGALDEARKLLRKVLYLDSRFIAAELELAELCARGGEVEAAQRIRARARRELQRLPPDTLLSAPEPVTAGELLQALGGAQGREVQEAGSDG